MSIKEKVYMTLPIFLQNIACNIEGDKIFKRRYSSFFFNVLEKIKNRDMLSHFDMHKLQIDRLKEQLILAYENTEYYKRYFDKYELNPYDFKNLLELEKLPIQTKKDIQNNIDIIINRNIAQEKYILNHTSGTTGSGLIFPETNECENEKWAIWWRYRINNGIKFDTWCAYFGGRSVVPLKQKNAPYWRIVKSTKQVMFSMYHLNEKNAIKYILEINKRKLEWIHGYPSTLSYLASIIIEQNLKINHKIKFVTIGSESLLDNQKVMIKKAFGIYPTQHYGLTEPVANISQCEFGKLHIDEDYSYVELIPITELNNKYRLIGTSFSNDALLFLRYDTSDIVSLAKEQTCQCGRKGRIIEEIDGRKDDFIIQKDGTKIGRLGFIFKDMINVRESQIKQLQNHKVIFYIVKNSKYTNSDEKILLNEIKKRLDVDYTIQYIDQINKTKNGKLKFVISEIKETK